MTSKSFRIVRRFLLILAIILVVSGTYFLSKNVKQPSVKPVELTNEATSSAETLVSSEIVRVISVIDGDTIVIEGGKHVRYIGMNTPELAHQNTPAQCFASDARDENTTLVGGKTVRLVRDISDTDTYGRLLRYVYVGDTMVNDTLVRQGFARVEPIPPDIKYQSLFSTAEKEAKTNNRGLWEACQK